jgi:membrane-bound ClpP family serine protease
MPMLWSYSLFSFTHFSTLQEPIMNKNVGTIDKALRIAVAAILAYLYFSGTVTGTLGIIALVMAIAALATSAIGFCGLYSILGINTCKVAKQ